MKIESILEETVKNKIIPWNNNPTIGWIENGDNFTLYYGTNKSTIKSILNEGIYASDDGYILCSLEPNTALINSRMRNLLCESGHPFSIVNTPVVFAIVIPTSVSNNMVILEDPKERMKKEIYESWGKSDVEYYALIAVGIPEHIPVNYIKGYMVK